MALASWFSSLRSPVQCQNKARPKRVPRCRPILEALEDRSVPTVGFGSALGIGNDTGPSAAADVVADASGNSYTTGYFSGTADFDPANTHPGDTDILTARGSRDAFVAKYAPDNSLVWALRMGGDSTVPGNFDNGRDIAIDGSGNVYVAGEFFGSADFGSKTLVSTGGGRDGFVAKLNSSGTVQWANRWGATGDDFGFGVGVDGSGNVYALGIRYYDDTYDVRKFKANGSADWTQSIVTHGRFGAELAVDASGNALVGGDFHGVVDFDPSNKTYYVSSGGSYSGFVLKLTSAGKLGWVSPFVTQTTSNTAFVQSIVLDGSGNVIVGGGYSGAVDFDPGSGTTILPTTGRAFITKLNNSGGLVWAKALESDNTTFVYGLAVDAAGSIYATGTFKGTVDFDPGAGASSRTTAGGWDVFVMKLDSAGNLGWAETFGATGDDIGFGIGVDSSGTIHLAGSYQGAVDFNPDPLAENWLTNPGAFSNMFLVWLTQS